jgi:hypothetical protein
MGRSRFGISAAETRTSNESCRKDLVAPFNAAHPTTPLTLDVLAGGTGDKKIRMAVISAKGPDIVMTPGAQHNLDAGAIRPSVYSC